MQLITNLKHLLYINRYTGTFTTKTTEKSSIRKSTLEFSVESADFDHGRTHQDNR